MAAAKFYGSLDGRRGNKRGILSAVFNDRTTADRDACANSFTNAINADAAITSDDSNAAGDAIPIARFKPACARYFSDNERAADGSTVRTGERPTRAR